MKASKKIVGATAALVAAVALSAGSTFAWFATSGTAKIDGLTVNVKSPTNLYIAASYTNNIDQITATEVKFTTTSATLSPVTPADSASGGSIAFQIPETWTTNPTASTSGTPATYEDVATVTLANGIQDAGTYKATEYVAGGAISLVRKAEESSSAAYTLKAVVTITGVVAENNNYQYLRCGFFDGTNLTNSGDLTQTEGKITWTAESLAANVQDNAVKNFVFLIWYDGDDEQCISSNAVKSDNLSVSIEFSTTTNS